MVTNLSSSPPRPAPRPEDARADLVLRAQAGDESALTELKALLGEHGSPYVELLGNLAAIVERTLLPGLFGKNLAAREALRRKLASLRAELAGPDPSPLERLLAERAASCWLTVYQYEWELVGLGALPAKQAEYHQRRIDAAHRRFLSSLKTLATVRRLAVPAIQVNVAEKQVNVVNR